MCDYPSWKELSDGTVLFLTDKDIDENDILSFDVNDCVGHSAIEKMYPNANGNNKEGFPCPPEIAKEIVRGNMSKMMAAGKYKQVHLNPNGELHRDDGPAIERAGGDKEWYKNGELHRDDGPAIERADGYKAWYKNGKKIK